MLSRCESRQRAYTELCNRSSPGSHGMVHVPSSHIHDAFEDYWEDASVSLRSCHSWEATLSPWLGATSPAHSEIREEDGNKRFSGLGSHQIRRRRYSFDLNERRSFPPPLASSPTLSIKEGGRFVLKEMDADRPQGFFRAQRGNGRLRLQLILPNDVYDEEDSEESSSTIEDTDESKVIEFDHVEHAACVEEVLTSNCEDCSRANEDEITSISTNKMGIDVCFDNSEGLWGGGHVCEVENFETGRPSVRNVGSEGLEFNACSTSQDVGKDVRRATLDKSPAHEINMKNPKQEGEIVLSLDDFYSDDPHQDISKCRTESVFLGTDNFLRQNFLSFGNLELNQFATERSNNCVEEEPLWNVDVTSQVLVASVSPWSPKPKCLHQSIVCSRPALGLAMS